LTPTQPKYHTSPSNPDIFLLKQNLDEHLPVLFPTALSAQIRKNKDATEITNLTIRLSMGLKMKQNP